MGTSLTPGVLWDYARNVLVRQTLLPSTPDATTYVRLKNWGNRYFYSLLLFLSSEEFPCVVGADRSWIIGPTTFARGMDRYARQAFSLPHVRFSSAPPAHPERMVFIHDGGWPELEEQAWRATIQVDYNIADAPPSDVPWQVMPLLMHPLVYASGQERMMESFRGNARPIRLFFAGNLDSAAYSSSPSTVAIRERFGIIDRAEVLRVMDEEFGSRIRWLQNVPEWNAILQTARPHRIVFAGKGGLRLPQSRWLDTLSRCDVFLAPPGVFFPLCHNLVEAMSVGTIPLTNYPDWYDPPLEHMRNCFAFQSREDLVKQTRLILDMGSSELARVREGVLQYYDRHFDRRTFPRRYLTNLALQSRLFVVTDSARRVQGITERSALLARQGVPDPVHSTESMNE